ncbi:MAG TPA: hypothetical protein VG125_25295 [Pirellulales bacterium]|jgi:hypothetical protein|nr:hypothetical protein [Pirellulales bacterium]
MVQTEEGLMEDNPYLPPQGDSSRDSSVRLRHSGIGIACFAIALTTALLEVITASYGIYLGNSTPGGFPEESPLGIFLLATFLVSLAIDLMGTGLGLAAIFQHDRKRLFALLGIGINVARFAIVVPLMVLGQ